MWPRAPRIASLWFEPCDIEVGVGGRAIETRVYVGGVVENLQRVPFRSDDIFESYPATKVVVDRLWSGREYNPGQDEQRE
jgi:hypothetical protein